MQGKFESGRGEDVPAAGGSGLPSSPGSPMPVAVDRQLPAIDRRFIAYHVRTALCGGNVDRLG
jgi:hypothetical protein